MASNTLMELDGNSFAETTKVGVTLVDFWAPWCGPCRMQVPILEKVALRIGDKARVAKVNVDDWPALAAQFGVRSIPTLLVLKNGEVLKQFIGVQPEASLVATLEAALA